MVHPALSETVAVLGGPAILATSIGAFRDFDRLIHEGVPIAALRSAIEGLQQPEARVVAALGIPRTTLYRRKATGRLGLVESERTVRLGRIAALGKLALGSAEATGRWLFKPNKALGGTVPLELLQTDVGAREVEAILGRALLGGYS